MIPDFRPSIRRALQTICNTDFLSVQRSRFGAPGVPTIKGLPTTRPAIARIARIIEAFNDGGFANATSLAKEFGTCTKTIHRDISWLKKLSKLPLRYCEHNKGFYLSGPVELPLLFQSEQTKGAIDPANTTRRQRGGPKQSVAKERGALRHSRVSTRLSRKTLARIYRPLAAMRAAIDARLGDCALETDPKKIAARFPLPISSIRPGVPAISRRKLKQVHPTIKEGK
jgi:hypothetical protein